MADCVTGLFTLRDGIELNKKPRAKSQQRGTRQGAAREGDNKKAARIAPMRLFS